MVAPTTMEENLEKTLGLLQTASFVLIQVFLVARLDRAINWSWYSVFAPWFAYESLQVLALFYDSCLFQVPPPDFSSTKSPSSNENGEGGEDDEEDKRLEIEMQYYYSVTKQQQGRSTIVSSLLRIWFAVFLAYKLNAVTDTPAPSVNWSWGLVLLPVWTYILSRYYYAFLSFYKSRQVIQSLQGQDLEDPGVRGRLMYGQNLSMSCFFTGCCTAVPILMSVLLVCSLEIQPISTFVIILPFFIALFLLLFCVCTVWCCFSTMDVNVDEEGQNDDKASGYVPPEESHPDMVSSPVVIYIPDEEGPVVGVQQQQDAALLPRPPPAPVSRNENCNLADDDEVVKDATDTTEITDID